VKLKIEQSDTEFYTPTAGLYFIGHAINQATTIRKTLRSVSRCHGIPNIELIRTYVGLLGMGKSDCEAVETSGTMTGSNTVVNAGLTHQLITVGMRIK